MGSKMHYYNLQREQERLCAYYVLHWHGFIRITVKALEEKRYIMQQELYLK